MIHINYLLTQRIENAQNGLRRVINKKENGNTLESLQRRTVECRTRGTPQFQVLMFRMNESYEDDANNGGKEYASGIGCKVEPFATSTTTGAISLKKFYQATHQSRRNDSKKDKFAPVALRVSAEVLNPNCQTRAPIHDEMRPLVNERNVFHASLRNEWRQREYPYK